MVTIREAAVADAAALAILAERTFRAAFGAANTAADMDAHCAEHYGEALQRAEIDAVDVVTLVAESRGDLIGFAQLRRAGTPPCVQAERPLEILRFYVDAAHHGTGVAGDLMTALLAYARERSADTVWLGVWEHNPRAVAFYRKAGFQSVGEHAFVLGQDVQRDIVMALPLGD
jgi:ribosomal protein S18 acetylase RimI-like enzyme